MSAVADGVGCGLCAPAARGRERRAAERRRARAAERDSIADGTALRNIVREEVAATFGDTEDLSPRALCLCRYAPPATYSHALSAFRGHYPCTCDKTTFWQ